MFSFMGKISSHIWVLVQLLYFLSLILYKYLITKCIHIEKCKELTYMYNGL